MGLPIIAVNLNGKRRQDPTLCPAIIRDQCVMHVSFEMKIIKYVLDSWPTWFRSALPQERAEGARHHVEETYKNLGL